MKSAGKIKNVFVVDENIIIPLGEVVQKYRYREKTVQIENKEIVEINEGNVRDQQVQGEE